MAIDNSNVGIEPEQLKAAIYTLPTEPHRMMIYMFRVDYSSIADQLRTLPPLEDAELAFGEYMLTGRPWHNVGKIENPTRQRVMDLVGFAPEPEDGKHPTDVLNASLKSLEWDYRPTSTSYISNPDRNILIPRNPNKIHPAYPQEVGFEHIPDDFRAGYENGNLGGINAAMLRLQDTPNSIVKMASGIFSVEYWGNKPDYLRSLESALEGTNRLTVRPHS